MAKASPIVSSFNAGEFSPLMAGRTDLKYYNNGCRRIRNFIPTIQGPARRRPGHRFVAEVKNSANRTWLAKFEFNVEQAYILEFGNLYIRFFSSHGVVGAPFEVVTPYATADLISATGTFKLRFVQSGDVLYICHPDFATRKLTRTGAATFVLSVLDQEGGPFKDVDPDNTITVYASAATGAGITITASSAIFLSTHIGSLFYIEQKNNDTTPMWEAGKAIGGAGFRRRSDGKNYVSTGAGTTGTIKPTHSVGNRQDGDAGVQWTFEDPGYGWAKITAIGGGGTTATADVKSAIPFLAVLVGNASTRWAHGDWSDEEGWPDNVTFFRERLCFARDRLVWQSVAGDFENFRDRDTGGVVTKEMAVKSDITSDRANRIEWLAPADTGLLVGTAGDETAISEITTNEAFGPGNVRARKQTEYGSRQVPPVRVGDGVYFAQKSGRKVRNMTFAWEKEGYHAPDVTVLAEHVTKTGITGMTFQQEPDSNVWLSLTSGALIGLTVNEDQEVKGWHPHRLGGYADANSRSYAKVEALQAIPAPDGDRDELWTITQRYINGGIKRYVEWQEYHHERGNDPEDAFYVDSGLTLNNTKNATLTPGVGANIKNTLDVTFIAGTPIFAAGDVGKYIHYRYSTVDITDKVTWHTSIVNITAFDSNVQIRGTINSAFQDLAAIPALGWRMTVSTITGLNHLIGQTVQVWLNGCAHPDCVVDATGAIALQTPGSKGHVGLACPAVLQPMPLEAGAADGTAQGKKQRITKAVLRFYESFGVLYGRDEQGVMAANEKLDRLQTRTGSTPMDEPPPLYNGDKVISWPSGTGDEEVPATMTIIADQPGPATIVAIMPQVFTQDAR